MLSCIRHSCPLFKSMLKGTGGARKEGFLDSACEIVVVDHV